MKAAHSLQQASASMAALFASAETLVEDLGQKIDARTSAHEKEFIATYRDQMKMYCIRSLAIITSYVDPTRRFWRLSRKCMSAMLRSGLSTESSLSRPILQGLLMKSSL